MAPLLFLLRFVPFGRFRGEGRCQEAGSREEKTMSEKKITNLNKQEAKGRAWKQGIYLLTAICSLSSVMSLIKSCGVTAGIELEEKS